MADLFGEEPDKIYEIVEELGRGQFGKVFKGVRKADREVVAIKILTIDETADDDTFRAVAKEIQMLRDCNHPNIVGFYGAYIKGNELWIIMEFCDAGSCSKMMNKMGDGFREEEIAAVLHQVLQGLEYLSKARKMHRDIKADNLLLKSSGEVKIADMGVATQLKNTMDFHKTATGTPYWMSPELVSQSRYNSKVDIWSLGITAIELAEKKPPLFDFVPMRALFMIAQQSRPPPKLSKPGEWSVAFNDFISKCLVKDPEERASATELLQHPFINEKSQQSRTIVAGLVQRYNQLMIEKQNQRAKERLGGSSLDRPLAADNMRRLLTIVEDDPSTAPPPPEDSPAAATHARDGEGADEEEEEDFTSEADDEDENQRPKWLVAKPLSKQTKENAKIGQQKKRDGEKMWLSQGMAPPPPAPPTTDHSLRTAPERKTSIYQRIKERKQIGRQQKSKDANSNESATAAITWRWWQEKEKKLRLKLKKLGSKSFISPVPGEPRISESKRGGGAGRNKAVKFDANKRVSKSDAGTDTEDEDEDDDEEAGAGRSRRRRRKPDDAYGDDEEDEDEEQEVQKQRQLASARMVAEKTPGVLSKTSRRWSFACFRTNGISHS